MEVTVKLGACLALRCIFVPVMLCGRMIRSLRLYGSDENKEATRKVISPELLAFKKRSRVAWYYIQLSKLARISNDTAFDRECILVPNYAFLCRRKGDREKGTKEREIAMETRILIAIFTTTTRD